MLTNAEQVLDPVGGVRRHISEIPQNSEWDTPIHLSYWEKPMWKLNQNLVPEGILQIIVVQQWRPTPFLAFTIVLYMLSLIPLGDYGTPDLIGTLPCLLSRLPHWFQLPVWTTEPVECGSLRAGWVSQRNGSIMAGWYFLENLCLFNSMFFFSLTRKWEVSWYESLICSSVETGSGLTTLTWIEIIFQTLKIYFCCPESEQISVLISKRV